MTYGPRNAETGYRTHATELPARYRVTATCRSCPFSGTLAELEMHDCELETTRAEHGGQCEDYPCCGHTDGDGCSPRQEHTMDYWLEVLSRRDSELDYYSD